MFARSQYCQGICLWRGRLKWPSNVQNDYGIHSSGDWGVSWFELLVSFYLTTGWRCPIRMEGAGAKSTYLDYGYPQALLLPDNKRSVIANPVFSQLVAKCHDSGAEEDHSKV